MNVAHLKRNEYRGALENRGRGGEKTGVTGGGVKCSTKGSSSRGRSRAFRPEVHVGLRIESNLSVTRRRSRNSANDAKTNPRENASRAISARIKFT